MNTMTADKEITFKLFYRKNRPAYGISVEEALYKLQILAVTEGWSFYTSYVDNSGRHIIGSARKPAYQWQAIAERAGINI